MSNSALHVSFVSFSAGNSDRRAVLGWLMEGGDPTQFVDGLPTWAVAMTDGHAQAVEDLLAAGAEPNQRSSDGRGWLHWAADTAQPPWLSLAGLARLDTTWWHPDAQGRTPFHLPSLAPAVAQAMGMRWWNEQRNWGELGHGEKSPEAVAVAHGSHALARVWRGWERVCSGRHLTR